MTDIEILERANNFVGIHYINGVEDPYISPCLIKAIKNGIAALREQEERNNPKPLTLDELRTMAGEPVWCAEYQRYGIVKVETVGRWANSPALVGVWHDRGIAGNYEYDIKKRRLTLFRSKPKSLNGGQNEADSV